MRAAAHASIVSVFIIMRFTSHARAVYHAYLYNTYYDGLHYGKAIYKAKDSRGAKRGAIDIRRFLPG